MSVRSIVRRSFSLDARDLCTFYVYVGRASLLSIDDGPQQWARVAYGKIHKEGRHRQKSTVRYTSNPVRFKFARGSDTTTCVGLANPGSTTFEVKKTYALFWQQN